MTIAVLVFPFFFQLIVDRGQIVLNPALSTHLASCTLWAAASFLLSTFDAWCRNMLNNYPCNELQLSHTHNNEMDASFQMLGSFQMTKETFWFAVFWVTIFVLWKGGLLVPTAVVTNWACPQTFAPQWAQRYSTVEMRMAPLEKWRVSRSPMLNPRELLALFRGWTGHFPWELGDFRGEIG